MNQTSEAAAERLSALAHAYKNSHRVDFETAWNAVKAENPDLVNTATGASPADGNETTPEGAAERLNALTNVYRNTHKVDFETAWEAVKAENPDLVKLGSVAAVPAFRPSERISI